MTYWPITGCVRECGRKTQISTRDFGQLAAFKDLGKSEEGKRTEHEDAFIRLSHFEIAATNQVILISLACTFYCFVFICVTINCYSTFARRNHLCCELCTMIHIQATAVAVDPTNSLEATAHSYPRGLTLWNIFFL